METPKDVDALEGGERAMCHLFEGAVWGGTLRPDGKGPPSRMCSSFSPIPLLTVEGRAARSDDKGHGRREIGEVIASTELNEFLGGWWGWVAQVFYGSPSRQDRQ